MKTGMTIVTILVLAAILGCQTVPQGESMLEGAGSGIARLSIATNRRLASFSRGESAVDRSIVAKDVSGPTVHLGYSKEASQENPTRSFMYFIPLISPVPVGTDTGTNDDQQAGIISYTRQVTPRTFHVKCEFSMTGTGFSQYTFDPAGMIALRSAEIPPGETLAHMLDYIRFEGTGFGSVQVRGTMAGSTPMVTEVSVEFNARGHESPVTIGLYEIKPRNGQYQYAHRSNEMVARVNALTFKKSESPRMGISVASITKKMQRAGLFGWFKATVANLLIKPVRIDECGNDTMLDFGHALLKQQTTFTFPMAGNLKDATLVAASWGQE